MANNNSQLNRLGNYIQEVNVRNTDLAVDTLLGVSISKEFIPSVANTVGTDMKNYKIVYKNQFVYISDTSRRGDKIGITILEDYEEAIVSQAYTVFEITDTEKLLPEYLMMWFRRPEFDRYARYKSHGSVRETFDWDEMCEVKLPIPSIEKQQQIVDEYNSVTNRIALNDKINQKLEETAQTIYKHWFVDFEFPDENGLPYKSNGGEMVYNEELDREIPLGWEVVELGEIAEMKYGKVLNSNLFEKEGYPVFSGYGIRGYYSEYMYKEPQILVLCRGVSGTGRVEMSPPYSYITNLSIIVELNNKELLKSYLYYYLKNENLRKLDSGSAQSQITINVLYTYKILVPCFDMYNEFSKKLEKINRYNENLEKQNQYLEELKSLLLARMSE